MSDTECGEGLILEGSERVHVQHDAQIGIQSQIVQRTPVRLRLCAFLLRTVSGIQFTLMFGAPVKWPVSREIGRNSANQPTPWSSSVFSCMTPYLEVRTMVRVSPNNSAPATTFCLYYGVPDLKPGQFDQKPTSE